MAIVLDIETVNFFNRLDQRPRELQLRDMIFGLAVTYDDQTGEYKEWGMKDLVALWLYMKSQTVCGWNIIDFDIPVIRYALQGDGYPADESIMAYDLFHLIRQKTGRWYSLNAATKANLGREKTADGLQAAKWLAEWLETKDETLYRQAMDYCRNDVALEYALYEKLSKGESLELPIVPEKKIFTRLLYNANGSVSEV